MRALNTKDDQIFSKLPYQMKPDWRVHVIFGIIFLPIIFLFLYVLIRNQDINSFLILIFFLMMWVGITLFLIRPRYKIFQDRLVFKSLRSQSIDVFYRDITKIEYNFGSSFNFYLRSTNEPLVLGFKNENKESLRILLKVIQKYATDIEIDKILFKILDVGEGKNFIEYIKKKPKITTYPFYIVGVITLIVFIINLSVIFSPGKSDYQEDVAEWVMMFIVILSAPLACSFYLFLAPCDMKVNKERTKTYVLVVITIASLLAFGYFQSQTYLDYYDNPSQIKGVLIEIESFGGRDIGIALTINPSEKIWKTGNDYSWRKIDYYISYFEQYLGKEITVTYTPRFNSLASLQDEQGNYIYRASDPCLKFISEDNYCK